MPRESRSARSRSSRARFSALIGLTPAPVEVVLRDEREAGVGDAPAGRDTTQERHDLLRSLGAAEGEEQECVVGREGVLVGRGAPGCGRHGSNLLMRRGVTTPRPTDGTVRGRTHAWEAVMHELRLVGVHEDGRHVLLADPTGQQYRLPLDEALRAADTARPAPARPAPDRDRGRPASAPRSRPSSAAACRPRRWPGAPDGRSRRSAASRDRCSPSASTSPAWPARSSSAPRRPARPSRTGSSPGCATAASNARVVCVGLGPWRRRACGW